MQFSYIWIREILIHDGAVGRGELQISRHFLWKLLYSFCAQPIVWIQFVPFKIHFSICELKNPSHFNVNWVPHYPPVTICFNIWVRRNEVRLFSEEVITLFRGIFNLKWDFIIAIRVVILILTTCVWMNKQYSKELNVLVFRTLLMELYTPISCIFKVLFSKTKFIDKRFIRTQ